ncbi:hypothetical protein ATCC51561_1740 [Campylobacter concisus ATCC 51561]|nr:hypothetical protein ATCC51561_1740 [Campylobacter concisus ATCC 51561]
MEFVVIVKQKMGFKFIISFCFLIMKDKKISDLFKLQIR